MSRALTERADVFMLVDKRRVFEGELPITALSRVCEQVVEPNSPVLYSLIFAREGEIRCARGWVAAQLSLQCQRCLGALDFPVRCDIALGFVESIDEAHRLPEGLDPVLLSDDHSVDPRELLEDEILLALPDVPRHVACPAQGKAEERAGADGAAKGKPFAGLAELLRSEKSDS